MRKKIIFIITILFCFICVKGNALAVTITVGSGQTYTTIAAGRAAMSSGDTLLIKNGTYNEVISNLPNGSSGAYTIIKAENDGGVVITQPFALTHTSAYIQFEGIKFSHSSGKSIVGNHLKFLRCAFSGGSSGGNSVNTGIGTNDYNDTQYILIEDCWFYGSGGRYKLMVYNSDRVVLRRVVARDDGGWTSDNSDPQAAIVIYQSSNVSLQNCIVIDSNLNTYDNDNVGAFYLTGHGGNRASDNAEYLGCMAINNKQWGLMVDTDDGAVGLKVRDLVIYGQEVGGIAQSNTSVAIDLQRAVIGATGYGVGNWGTKINTLSDFLFVALTGISSKGANTLSNYSTFATYGEAKADGLSYLTRTESGSALASAGRGASIQYQIGKSGTHWGDSGYNTKSAVSLWPWPNEARIKSDMASVSPRGFATGTSRDGSPQTLTKYIWEYLGYTIPDDIYGVPVSDPTIPVVTAFTMPTFSSSLTVVINSFAATDNIVVTGYMVTESLTRPDAGSNNWSSVPPNTFTFSSSGTKTAYAWAKDLAGNISAPVSQNVTVTIPVPDTIPPTVMAFTLPANATTLSVPVLNFTTTDNQGVTGYLINESATVPSASATGWSTTAPTTITFSSTGSKTAYSWAKDGAGNISSSMAAPVTIAESAPSLDCSATNVRCVDDTYGSTQEYLTIQAAFNVAVAGDTILVHPGNYSGFQVNRSGTNSNPIVIKANGSGVNITSPVTVNGESDGIYINNSSHVAIDGFNILNNPYRCIAARGATATSPMLGLIIKNNICAGSQHEAIYISQVGSSLIEGNTITSSGSNGAARGHGIYLANAGSDNTILRGNTISGMLSSDSAGIHINGDLSVGGDGLITGLTIENNTIFNGPQNGLSMDGVQDSLIRNNLIYGMASSAARGFQIDGAGGPQRLVFINNSFANNNNWAIKLSNEGLGNVVFNNILLSTSGSICVGNPINIASNYNIVENKFSNNGDSSTVSLSSWRATGNDANSIISTPANTFNNAINSDYTLSSISLALDIGVSSFSSKSAPLTDILGLARPQGNGYDIGAYEAFVNSGVSNPKNLGVKSISQ